MLLAFASGTRGFYSGKCIGLRHAIHGALRFRYCVLFVLMIHGRLSDRGHCVKKCQETRSRLFRLLLKFSKLRIFPMTECREAFVSTRTTYATATRQTEASRSLTDETLAKRLASRRGGLLNKPDRKTTLAAATQDEGNNLLGT